MRQYAERDKMRRTGICGISIALILALNLTGCNVNINLNKEQSHKSFEPGNPISYQDYELEQVVVLSRHNIRAPLSTKGSLLETITPYQWHEWSSQAGELSLRGGVLETEMGQYFRKWMEEEGLIEENYQPEDEEVRIYANSKQRTIATASFFSSGCFPTANIDVEYHEEMDKMDPVFLPGLHFCSADYSIDANNEIYDIFEAKIKNLSDNYILLEDVIDMEHSKAYEENEIASFNTDDTVIDLQEGEEPSMTGSLRTACSVSDALVLQYYEKSDPKEAAFGNDLTQKQWEDIAEIKDVYEDVLFTSPMIAVNVANPLLVEIDSELNNRKRVFSYLCGHDSNLESVLAALKVKEYKLPYAIEKKTPIGCKLVISKWKNSADEEFCSVDLIYQTTEQLRSQPLLDLVNPPYVYSLEFEGINRNADGLFLLKDIEKQIDDAIDEYDLLYEEYAQEKAA